MAMNDIKKFLTTLAIRKIQNKIKMSHKHTPTRIAKRSTTSNVGKDVEQSKLSHIVSKNVKWYNYFGWRSDSFLKQKLPMNQQFHFSVFT